MRKSMQIAAVLLVLLCALPVWAATPTGEVYGNVQMEWDRGEKKVVHAATLTGFRLALEDELGSIGKVHASVKGSLEWKTQEATLGLDQLWLRGYAGDFDYQVGKQLISWGTADGFNPTNYFTRVSSSALLSGDLGGEAVWAGRLEYYAPSWSATGVVIPVFTPQKVDSLMAKMLQESGPFGAMILQAIESTKKPNGLQGAELALRAETQLAGFDVRASYFRGYEPLPGLELVFGPSGMTVEGTYRRQQFFGLAMAGTIGSAGVWAEAAYGGPEKFAESSNPYEMRVPLSINRKSLQAVIGGDYTVDIGRGLLVQAQYIFRGQGSLLEPYVPPKETMEPGEFTPAHYFYTRLAYDFNPDNSADLVVLYGTKEKGGIIRPSYTHRFDGGFQLELSVLYPFGEKDGDFDVFTPQAALAVKYQF